MVAQNKKRNSTIDVAKGNEDKNGKLRILWYC